MKKSSQYQRLFPLNFLILSCIILAALLGSNAITVISENTAPRQTQCIIIDAGHGGVDGGAVSCTGIYESQINLEIALRLDDLLHLLGIRTIMIRDTDISVYTEGESIAAKKISDLKNRVHLINTTPNATLISIHQNYFEDNRYTGAQVFYTAKDQSISFAKALQTAFIQTLNHGSRRQAKKATGVYLMKNINCPGILVECGFLSNSSEEALLRTGEYQKKICCVIAVAASHYLAKQNIA